MFYLVTIITIAFSIALGFNILCNPLLKSSANRYFAFAILTVALLLSNMVLYGLGFFETYGVFKIVYEIEWLFLFPVFIFFFCVKTTTNHFEDSEYLMWLYIPFFYSVLLNCINIMERDFSLFSLTNPVLLRTRELLFIFENSFIYLFNFFILGWLFFILKHYDNQEHILWIKKLLFLILSLMLVWIGFNFTESVVSDTYATIFASILCIGLSVFIYWVAYHVFYRDKLTVEGSEINAIIASNPINIKETKQRTNQKISNPHLANFENLLKQQFIYRDPNLTRESVAELLGISSGYLSQIITLNGSENFSSYINKYRVEEVKQMLCDSTFDKYNVESIGLEAGFSSKTTFYKTFKKITGLTPNAFKNLNK